MRWLALLALTPLFFLRPADAQAPPTTSFPCPLVTFPETLPPECLHPAPSTTATTSPTSTSTTSSTTTTTAVALTTTAAPIAETIVLPPTR